MNIGARILKTGISVSLALFVSHLLQLETPVFSAIAAFLAVQPSVYRSWAHLLEQIQANIIGALFAIIGLYFFGYNPLIIGLIVVLLIALNAKLQVNNIGLSVLTAIAILEVRETAFYLFAWERFLTVMIGVFSSIIINIIFLPPKYEDKLFHHIETTSEQLSVLLRSVIYNELEKNAYQEAKEIAEKNILEAKNLFSLYQDEFNRPFKKTTFQKAKKLVIFKHMILLLKKELDTLYTFENQQVALNNLPNDFKNRLQTHLSLLTTYDEKIFMKYEGKVKLSTLHESINEIDEKNAQLLKDLYDESNRGNLFFISLTSAIFELSDELKKLDHLVHLYKKK